MKDKNVIINECAICTLHKKDVVTCAKCLGSSCKDCFQMYLLNSTLTPTCMHCKTSLSDDFVLENTKVTWRSKSYKVYREALLFDIERSRLPETQAAASLYQTAKKTLTPVLERVALRKTALKQNLVGLRAEWAKGNSATIQGLYKQRLALRKEARPDNRLLYKWRPFVNTWGLATAPAPAPAPAASQKQTISCPAADCKAFLNADFVCTMCNAAVCKKCHEVMVNGHECNPDTVETIKALKAEAKGCPTCSALISKIDGCDQMWCTQCQTTFSWRTGLVEKGNTHNPHYYEWMRKNGGLPRAPGDLLQACGGYPALHQLMGAWLADDLDAIRQMDRLRSRDAVTDVQVVIYQLMEYHRLVNHMDRFHGSGVPLVNPDNHDLRVQYLCKELTDVQTKLHLQRRDKAYRKGLAKKQIYAMAHTAAGDIFRALIENKDSDLAVMSIRNLLTYANECLDRVSAQYSCVTPKFNILNGLDFMKLH